MMRIAIACVVLAGCLSPETDLHSAVTSALVGHWREVAVRPGHPNPLVEISFDADGTFTTGTSSGTFDATADELTFVDTDTTMQTYALEGDLLMIGAMLPDGAHTGPVGVWRGHSEYNGVTGANVTELDANGNGAWTSGDEHYTGPWHVEGANVVVELTELDDATTQVFLDLQVIPERALGFPLYERLP